MLPSQTSVASTRGAAAGKTDLFGLAEKEVAKRPWMQSLEEDKSDLTLLINTGPKMFTTSQKSLVQIANLLQIADGEVKDFLSMPMVNGSRLLVGAIVFQNIM